MKKEVTNSEKSKTHQIEIINKRIAQLEDLYEFQLEIGEDTAPVQEKIAYLEKEVRKLES